MVHWVLGIGDRHLENCMLSLTSGHLVGIDFGRAFGTSNYVIPIPEMVPFRLTPQIQNIMLPYTYKGKKDFLKIVSEISDVTILLINFPLTDRTLS